MKNFEIDNTLYLETTIDTGRKIIINNDFAEAEIYLFGGHLTHFRPKNEEKIIFDGKESYVLPSKSAHFGIPICWPWFGPHPTDSSKPQHGFARNNLWRIQKTKILSDGQTFVKLQLEENKETLAIYPYAFKLEISFTIGKTLDIELTTHNTSNSIIQVTQALHNYFFVDEIQAVSIHGLENTEFIDQLDKYKRKKEISPLQFTQKLDRIYIPTINTCEIIDTQLKRKIIVSKNNSYCTVIWNPWKKNSLHDIGDEKYKKFICVESANVKGDIITLNPGRSYTLIQKISLAHL